MLPLKRWVLTSQAEMDTIAAAAERTRSYQPDEWSTTTDHDTVAYYGRINVLLLAAEAGGDATLAREQLDRLWSMRYLGTTGNPGLGLDFAFDAFGDGSSNPTSTLYTYTMGMAALTWLDAYRVLGDARWLTYATAMVDTLLDTDDCWGFEEGSGRMSVWYDDQAADKVGSTYVVHNVNALTLAAIRRIERYTSTVAYATKATGMQKMLQETAQVSNGLEAEWQYRYGTGTNNDQVHQEYLVEACLESGIQWAPQAERQAWAAYWLSDGTPNTANSQTMGSSLWGPGEMLGGFALSPLWHGHAHRAATVLAASIDAGGLSSYADPTEPRSNVRYGFGLARFVARCTTDADIFPDARVTVP